jgi:uncharacterized delta-60 repeat protein
MIRSWLNRTMNWTRNADRRSHSARACRPLHGWERLEDRVVPAAAGTLDASFGSGGSVIYAVKPGAENILNDVAVQSDGKIVAVGRVSGNTDFYDSVVTRFNADGSIDTSFGSNGSTIVSFANREAFNAVAIQSDGKIVAGGSNDGAFILARFLPDGTLDPSFGSGGKETLIITPGEDGLADLAIQPDGKIVAVGEISFGFGIVRLNSDGTFDTTFGNGGVITRDNGTFSLYTSVALQPDGKIVAAGYPVTTIQRNDLLNIARFNPDGSMDTSFGVNGLVKTGYGPGIADTIEDMALQPDGRIVVTGLVAYDLVGTTDFAVMRLNTNGTKDNTFGTGGVVFSGYTDGHDDGQGILVQNNGQIVVVGSISFNSLIARLNADGSRDTNFGTESSLGRTVVDLRPGDREADYFTAVALQNGKLLAAGTSGTGGASEKFFTLARFEPGGTPPTADAGGPYAVDEQSSAQLDASGSTDPDQPANTLTYSWDLDGDGIFGETGAIATRGDEVGIAPTFSAAGIDGPALITVSLRVTDNDGMTSSDTATITVNNVAPIAAVNGPTDGVPGQPRTFTLTASDVSPADQAAGFTFRIDWDGDGIVDETDSGPSGLTVDHAFTATGAFTVKVTATDDDGGVSAVATHDISIVSARLQADPVNNALTALFVGGSTGMDVIALSRAGGMGSIRVDINGVLQGVFQPTGHLIAYGLGGNDTISVASNVDSPAILFGGDGNDTLSGGGGNNILLGEAGDDTLDGGGQRDVLIGGTGADTIRAHGDDDLLIASATAYDGNIVALDAVMAEWKRTDASYTTRVLHLTGALGGGLNGATALNAGTVLDDNVADTLEGDSGQDFYFANLTGAGVLDAILDLKNQESVYEL